MRRPPLARGVRALSILAALLAFGTAATAFAQTDVTTSRISGTVRDVDGGALPGTTVEAKNQGTGLVQTAVTRADGFYQVINLPSGVYTLTASLPGFKAAARPDIRLDIGTAPTVDFRLQLSTVQEVVTVTSSVPAVEVTNTAASTTIQTEQLKSLPINGRNFQDLVLLTPETRRDPENRGTVLVSGQRGINTNTTVDGMDYDNGFFGGTFGSAEGRAPLSISAESVKEFTVIRNGGSVEFGPSGGGVINVITKSGTNDLHGSGFYYWQPHSTVARLSNGLEAPDQKKKQYGGSVGGPILRDHLFFFGSYDQQKQDVGIPVNSVLLDPSIAATYPTLASDPTYTQTQDGRVLFGRLDYQVTGSHRLMARVNYAQYEGDHGTSSSQNQTSNHNGIEGLQSHAYVGSWTSQWGSSFLNDLNGQYVVEQTPRIPAGVDQPEIRYGSFSLGSTSFLPIFSTAERTSVGDTGTFLFKDHVVKGGAEYNKTSISQIFKGNWRGVYVFAGNQLANFLAGKWTQYFQFGGLGGRSADEAGTAAFAQKELAFFVQDQWFVSPKLTVTAGVRYERLDNPDNPILNSNHVNPDGSFALDGKIPDQNNKWSPRAGFTYAPDSKTAIRLSLGRFWARTPGILFAQLITSNGLTGTQYTINAGGTTVQVRSRFAQLSAPLHQQPRVLHGGDLVRGQGQRLQRAQLRRRAGGGPPQPRRQLQLGEPRSAVEVRGERDLEYPVVRHRAFGNVPLHERLAFYGCNGRRREPRRVLQRPSHDRRRPLLPQPVPATEVLPVRFSARQNVQRRTGRPDRHRGMLQLHEQQELVRHELHVGDRTDSFLYVRDRQRGLEPSADAPVRRTRRLLAESGTRDGRGEAPPVSFAVPPVILSGAKDPLLWSQGFFGAPCLRMTRRSRTTRKPSPLP